MRKCAEMTEVFASFVNGGAISADSHVSRLIRDLVVPAKTDAITDEKVAGKRKRKVDATEDGEAPKRRKRKPKDPNAPKRPASSYIIFQNEVRGELKASHPSLSNNELLNMIAKQWQEMNEEDKAVYHQAMATAKERYSQDKKAYDNRTAEEVEAANAAASAAAANRKVRKYTKSEAPAPTKTKAAPPVAVDKPTNSPSTEVSEGSASEESDEEVHEDRDEEHDSASSEEEVPKRVAVTAVTSASKEKKRAKA
ncbi:hypothetical protein AX15_003335 [Amanita polypyramis BW_CC]|nr:hypothetical protein AX15_003335 [Amanita polypyramis BW_CC]